MHNKIHTTQHRLHTHKTTQRNPVHTWYPHATYSRTCNTYSKAPNTQRSSTGALNRQMPHIHTLHSKHKTHMGAQTQFRRTKQFCNLGRHGDHVAKTVLSSCRIAAGGSFREPWSSWVLSPYWPLGRSGVHPWARLPSSSQPHPMTKSDSHSKESWTPFQSEDQK